MFVAWLVEPPRQSGAGERGSGRAAAQAAAQEQQQRKVYRGNTATSLVFEGGSRGGNSPKKQSKTDVTRFP